MKPKPSSLYQPDALKQFLLYHRTYFRILKSKANTFGKISVARILNSNEPFVIYSGVFKLLS